MGRKRTYRYSDGGREASGRGPCLVGGDCLIRALTLITGEPYDHVWNTVADIYAAHGGERNADKVHHSYTYAMHHFGYQAYIVDYPRASIAALGREGDCMAQSHQHVVPVINGVVYDVFDSRHLRPKLVWRMES